MKIDFLKIKSNYIKSYIRQINNPNVLFIWIPKNAGTSIYEELNKSCNMELFLSYIDAKNRFVNKGMATFGHLSINELIEKSIIDKAYYEKAYVFSVCRNPYDRFVSLFHYLKKEGRIPENYKCIDLIQDVVKGIEPIGLYNYRGLSQCNKQVDWIDALRVDEVLKFENLESEIHELTKHTGKKLGLMHKNKSDSRKKAYEELDIQTIKLIKDYYEPDFLRFNYSMDICENINKSPEL